jgi:hypothetical protein
LNTPIKTVNGNKETESIQYEFNFNINRMFKYQFCYNQLTDLFQSTINVPQIPPSTSDHFATRVRRSRVVRLSRSSRFSMTASSIQNASEQFVCCIHLSFANFARHSTSQTKI